MTPVPPLEELVRITAVARRMKLDVQTVHRWRSDGRLSAWRVGRTWYTTEREVERFIQAGTRSASEPVAPAVPHYGRARRKEIDEAMAFCRKRLGL